MGEEQHHQQAVVAKVAMKKAEQDEWTAAVLSKNIDQKENLQ